LRKFLIATHGTFAGGIKSSLDIIIGETENVFIIEAYVDGNKSIEDALNNVLKNINADDELIVFSDLLGGSITNQILRYALKENVHVVSGINLPLLIEVALADNEMPIIEVLQIAITNAKDQIVYVNKLVAENKEEDNYD
jgi:fructoselysine and glucoselysine-specific PTS system IIA component